MKFVACYIRVSTVGTTQAMQRREINRWLKSNRFNAKAVRWYIDKSASLQHRPKFDELKADVLDGKVRAVVVSHLDRLATTPREGLNALIDWCEQSLRVVSVSQQIDVKSEDSTTVGAVLRGTLEISKVTKRKRSKAGSDSAKARGALGGRPRGSTKAEPARAKELAKKGMSIPEIVAALGVSRASVYRYLQE